jgi:hypothetical protein
MPLLSLFFCPDEIFLLLIMENSKTCKHLFQMHVPEMNFQAHTVTDVLK